MMTHLYDFNATHGIYRARVCEWNLNGSKCNSTNIVTGYAYCKEHMSMAYTNTSDNKHKGGD